jgi:hypothetical protein
MRALPLSGEYIRPTYAMVILHHDVCNKGAHKVKLVKASKLREKESHVSITFDRGYDKGCL